MEDPTLMDEMDTEIEQGSDTVDAPSEAEQPPADPVVAEATPSDVTVLDEDDLFEEEAEEPEISPYDRPGKWYVLHAQSGYENKVKTNLEMRAQTLGVDQQIHEVVVPIEEITQLKDGKKKIVKQKR